MNIRVHNIKLPLDAGHDEIKEAALRLAGCSQEDCLDFRIAKQSVDARKKQVSFVYSVDLHVQKKIHADGKNIVILEQEQEKPPERGIKRRCSRPIVVGSGPCGLFCALTLARQGYRPLILERGADVDSRTAAVERFWTGGTLDTETNVQFGEGGAGTFSDGKLTTRISDPRVMKILKAFVSFGAPEEILYRAKPHIGTDILKNVVKSIRQEIIRLGGEVRFCSRVDELMTNGNKICGVRLSTGEELLCDVLILALGHSARDTYEMLFSKGIAMEAKAFSVGARVEHLQSYIDEAMYGEFAGHPKLGAADYQLSWRDHEGNACYSFCMCPGGSVVAAASEENMVVTNGMSNYARAAKNANSAICANVTPRDFGSAHPLAGVEYQRELERRAFLLGGKNYHAPAQLVRDFLDGNRTNTLGQVVPSYLPGVSFVDLNSCFSTRVSRVLAKGLCRFEEKMKGFVSSDAVLTGVETRTSAPVRILRNEKMESCSYVGLYPAGEGAGYAGGIMSAAADGVKVAEKIIEKYRFVE